jgi:hypothetical protein
MPWSHARWSSRSPNRSTVVTVGVVIDDDWHQLTGTT